MRGWLVYNAFVRDDEYDALLQSFEDAAETLGIALERRTNVELAPLLGAVNGLPDLPDFALFWCKDIQVARHLEAHGVRLFNCAEAIEISDDKAATVAALLGVAGVRQPRTVPVPRSDASTLWDNTGFAEQTAQTLGLPVVVKEVRGSFGQEVFLAHSVAELVEVLNRLSGHACICQEFITSSRGRDVRVQVVGGRAVGALLRYSENGDFRANINNGASFQGWKPTVEQAAMAITATQELGLDFAGVDLLFGADEKPILCEVNANAHSLEMLDECDVDVAAEIMRHIQMTIEKERNMSKTMKALSISDVTPANKARLSDVPIPAARPGWVLVRVRGIGMNHSEWELRHDEIRESYISKPIIPGIEGVGEVVDPSDQPFVVGQKVCMLMGGMGRMWDGSYAEYCLVRADHLFAIPEAACRLPWRTLAAVPETFFTAWGSLFECLQLKADDTLMIRGASCGLGYASIQIAKALGAHVVATTHRERYFELLERFGADKLVLDDGKLADTGVRANKVLELIGPKTLRDSLGCLNHGGICCDTGILGGEFTLDGFDPIKGIPNGCYLTGFFSNYPTQQTMDDIFTFIADHDIEPFVAQVFDFDHLLDALALQDAGGFQGKLVIINE